MKIILVCVSALLFFDSAYACHCFGTNKRADKYEDAAKNASLIMLGTVEETLWRGPSKSKTTCYKDRSMCIDIDHYHEPDAPEIPFDVHGGRGGGYTAIINVSHIWKDEDDYVKDKKIRVATGLLGWDGFVFEKGEKYLIYGRNGGNENALPCTSICTRTRPFEYSHDDIDKLNLDYPNRRYTANPDWGYKTLDNPTGE